MNERLGSIEFSLFLQADADDIQPQYIPEAFKCTHISHSLAAAGTPTAETIDVDDDGTNVIAAQDVSTPALTELTTPVRFAKGSLLALDVNLTGGTTPTETGKVVLWGFWGE